MKSRNAAFTAIAVTAILVLSSSYAFYTYGTAGVPTDWRQLENYVPVTNTTLTYYSSLNHNNSLQFTYDVTHPCAQQVSSAGVGVALMGLCARFITTITHQEHSAASIVLLKEGFNASCLLNCNGVIYSKDPTTVMTNTGHDFYQFKLFGSCVVIGCAAGSKTWRDNATFLEISTSTTVPAVTDTGCGGGVGAGQITTGGLADIAGTVTGGTAASGSVTTTVAHTWTAAETDTAIQDLCLNTELHTGTNIVLVISGQFGPDSLVSGNTFAGTVQVVGT